MKRFRVRSGVLMLLFLLLTGCSAGRPAASPDVAGPSGPELVRVSEPALPSQPVSPEPAPSPDSLNQQLERRSAPVSPPAFTWQKPPASKGYTPLTSGVLLVYTAILSPQTATEPFVISGLDATGAELWSRELPLTSQQVESLDISADGERVAVIGRSRNVTVLESRTGRVLKQFAFEPGASSVGFIDNGRALAVTIQTMSGLYRRGVDVYPIASTAAEPAYGISGSEVFTSPYHGLLLGVVEAGVRVVGPSGVLGTVAGALPQRDVMMHISGDGRRIFVWGSDSGKLHIYDERLALVGEPIPVDQPALHFPADAPYYYLGNAVVFRDQTTRPLSFDTTKWHIRTVLHGGELVLSPNSQEKVQCVVTPEGRLFGCLPWVSQSWRGNGTVFWYSDEKWVYAYQL